MKLQHKYVSSLLSSQKWFKTCFFQPTIPLETHSHNGACVFPTVQRNNRENESMRYIDFPNIFGKC